MKTYGLVDLKAKSKDELIAIIKERGAEVVRLQAESQWDKQEIEALKAKTQTSEDALSKTIARGVFSALKMESMVKHLDRLRFSKSEAIRLIVQLISSQRDELTNLNRLWANEQRKRSQKEMYKSFKSKDKPTKHEMYLEAMKGRRPEANVR